MTGFLRAIPMLRTTCMVPALWLAAMTTVRTAAAQQVADSAFVAHTGAPRWKAGEGPLLVLDEAHHNFHTLDGRYLTFGRMATGIGFRVQPLRRQFSDEALRNVSVLVIANALNERNGSGNWALPTPSAFDAAEIAAVVRFVEQGGGLLLVADHMPFAGAAEQLGRALGVQFVNGFAFASPEKDAESVLVYRRSSGLRSPLTGAGTVDSIVAFTGSAFRLLRGGVPLMTLPRASHIWLPKTAWVFGDTVPSIQGEDWLQGAALSIGTGRVVVLGEAAMLSAQRAGAQRAPMGMNEPRAQQNALYAAQLLRWLAGEGRAIAPSRE